MKTKKHLFTWMLLALLIALYSYINWSTLTTFPYVHSDEAWLSGFSRTVLDKGSFVTVEPFFDLYPRAIHGLRVIFVSLQIMMIQLFGYSIFSMRLLSLIGGLACLFLIYKHFRASCYQLIEALLMTGIIAAMCQFMMMSHIARQEPLILLGMLAAYYFTVHSHHPYKHILIPAIIGLCIGVHPNSFIVGLGIGLIYCYDLYKGTIHFKTLVLYVIQLGLWAGFFIAVSFKLNPNFLQDYLAFGDQLGVVNHSLTRLEGFYYYYYKLWHQIGGTYVLVPIKIDLVITFTAFITSIILSIKKKHPPYALLMFTGINLGLFIIGRYNQTAIIFPLIFGWLMLFDALKELNSPKWRYVLLGFFLLLQLQNTYETIDARSHESYEAFGQSVIQSIPKDAKVLGNLNLDYHLDLYQLYDIRNLDYLEEYKLSFADYIQKNNISYIVLYEEMSYIHEADGKWSILYGDLSYYEDMMTFIETHTILVDQVEAPTYGMRIAKYVDVYPWSVTIYKIK